VTDETETPPPTETDGDRAKRRAAQEFGRNAMREQLSLDLYGPCQREDCGDALALHDPCSKCRCPSFIGKGP